MTEQEARTVETPVGLAARGCCTLLAPPLIAAAILLEAYGGTSLVCGSVSAILAVICTFGSASYSIQEAGGNTVHEEYRLKRLAEMAAIEIGVALVTFATLRLAGK